MNILDYVILGVLAIGMIIGLVKGLIKQLLTVGGIVVVALLTATVSPFVQNWLSGVIAAEGTRAAVAMFASVVLIAVVYGVIAWLISKALKKVKIIKALDKILGGVVSIVVVYLVFAVIFGVFTMTGEEFLPKLKSLLGDQIENSWFAQKIYGVDVNFFGKWVVEGIAEKLIQSFQPAEEAARALLR